MKIAILGTRGVPNYHGGFEQFAEHFSVSLANKNHQVCVYNSHNHPFQKSKYKNVNIIHCFDPENTIGTVGQFIYDLNCILHAKRQNFDIILQLGYTSSSIWHFLLPKKPVIITNMDGLEWKRSKYSKKVQRFLKFAEKLAVKNSDYLIADSIGIQDYLKETYVVDSEYIAYGANVFDNADPTILENYKLEKNNYCLIIARLEPENNIETLLEGYSKSASDYPLIIFGGLNDYGKTLQKKFSNDERIIFKGANYNQNELNNLRYFSRYYFHGHSVGGTNPSLLEAMASNTLIIAHDNIFNKSILKEEALYFQSSEDVLKLMNIDRAYSLKSKFSKINRQRIKENFNWDKINFQYEMFILGKLKN